MEKQPIIITQDLSKDIREAINRTSPDRLFVLVDENTARLCWPRLRDALSQGSEHHDKVPTPALITIAPSDEAKNTETLAAVWTALSQGGATRHSLLINLGGGMVTDLGGFAAATFKRGISFINIPTTLLAMVDASVGGKTGINFCGLKNEIGVFRDADVVLLDTEILSTLDRANILSGYAEMLKHGLISYSNELNALLQFDIEKPDLKALQEMVVRSVEVKQRIVLQDPHEQGLRKALNLGHTAGHAFESMALAQGRPVLHGYAVAWGLVCELYLAATRCGFPSQVLHQVRHFVQDHYGRFPLDCRNYDRLYELMTHDKKNTAGHINFTLLANVGEILINQSASKEDIFEMLDFYRES
ncbi:MAG: 3-dehydroquinate synthase [Bacteroidaceae bacterium]|nr:3-dehydroquinate synthase [Bacteroidaceae bacterium]